MEFDEFGRIYGYEDLYDDMEMDINVGCSVLNFKVFC